MQKWPLLLLGFLIVQGVLVVAFVWGTGMWDTVAHQTTTGGSTSDSITGSITATTDSSSSSSAVSIGKEKTRSPTCEPGGVGAGPKEDVKVLILATTARSEHGKARRKATRETWWKAAGMKDASFLTKHKVSLKFMLGGQCEVPDHVQPFGHWDCKWADGKTPEMFPIAMPAHEKYLAKLAKDLKQEQEQHGDLLLMEHFVGKQV